MHTVNIRLQSELHADVWSVLANVAVAPDSVQFQADVDVDVMTIVGSSVCGHSSTCAVDHAQLAVADLIQDERFQIRRRHSTQHTTSVFVAFGKLAWLQRTRQISIKNGTGSVVTGRKAACTVQFK